MSPPLPPGEVVVAVEDAIATVRLHRPERHNALSPPMWERLRAVMEEVGADPAVRVVVVLGAGDHFCAGADLFELPDDPADFAELHEAAERAVAACPKPVLAAIRGSCVGGGCEIAVACDLRFAEPGTRIGITASRIGVVYPERATRRLVELVGPGPARRLLLAGELFDVDWALRVGLVDEVVPDAEAAALAMAALLRERAPATIAAAKHVITGPEVPAPDLREAAADYREGVAAFRARRAPRFGTRPGPVSP